MFQRLSAFAATATAKLVRIQIAGAALAAAFAAQPASAASLVVLNTYHNDPTTGYLAPIDGSHTEAVEWTQAAATIDPRVDVVMLQRALQNPVADWTLTSVAPDGTPGAVLETGFLRDARPLAAVIHDEFDFGTDQLTAVLGASLPAGSYALILSPSAGALSDNSLWVGAAGSDVGVIAQAGFRLDGFYLHDDTVASGWRPDTRGFGFFLEGPAAVPEPATWTMLLLGLGFTGAVLRSRRRLAGVGVGAEQGA